MESTLDLRIVLDRFWTALRLRPQDREGFLAELAHDNPALARAVEQRLAHAEAPAVQQRLCLLIQDDPLHMEEEIGRGATGVVYRARNRALGRLEAIKVLHSVAGQDRFLKEALAVSKLKHPNIAQVFAVDFRGGQPYISMEYIDGQNLFARKPDLVGDHMQVAVLVRTIARAIGHAHDAGIIHRDLKPENILINKQGDPVIVDFGCAKISGDQAALTLDGDLIGSPKYMAPEQIAQATGVGPPADVYAIGVILYELLTGEAPFEGSIPEVLDAVANQKPVRPRKREGSIPRDLEAICLKCLRKEPEHRYRTANELADDLRRHLDGVVVRAYDLYRLRSFLLPLDRKSRKRVLLVAKRATPAYMVLVLLVTASWPTLRMWHAQAYDFATEQSVIAKAVSAKIWFTLANRRFPNRDEEEFVLPPQSDPLRRKRERVEYVQESYEQEVADSEREEQEAAANPQRARPRGIFFHVRPGLPPGTP